MRMCKNCDKTKIFFSRLNITLKKEKKDKGGKSPDSSLLYHPKVLKPNMKGIQGQTKDHNNSQIFPNKRK